MLLHQVFSFNSPVWFNVGTAVAAAGQRVLHPVGRRLDGLHPGLVQGGGADLQGWLRLRRQPLPDPVLQGAAVLRRHRVRPGQLHARRRRQRRDDQVRRRHPACGQDGHPGRRPPGHRGVRHHQGARGEEDPRASGRRLRHGPRWFRHRQRAVPERQQLGPRQRRVHERGRERQFVRAARPPARRGHRDRRREEAVPRHRPGRLGVRRPRPAVRRHHQRLAHQPGDRPDHGLQPLLRVHVAGRLVVQPGLPEPDEVPQGRRRLRGREVRQERRVHHHRDGHLDLLRRLPDGEDRRDHPRVPPARHRIRQPGCAADGLRTFRTTRRAAAVSPPRSPR